MTRETIFTYAADQYGTDPEYLWAKYPNFAVLRHPGNRKWYAAVMDVPREKLGLTGPGVVDILNVKEGTRVIGSLRGTAGILPAYHMNKENWVSVLLDGTVEDSTVLALLDMSFSLTAPKKRGRVTKEQREAFSGENRRRGQTERTGGKEGG